MVTCANCQAGVPEGMRFCLQCGAAITPTPPPMAPRVVAEPSMPAGDVAPPIPYVAPTPPPSVIAPPEAPQKGSTTVPLKIAATPVMAPRTVAPAWQTRPSLGDQMEEIDEESLKKSFERPVTKPGAVVCRFCKGPLDLEGDFCEQCGAPVSEAAPPGTLRPKPQAAPPPISSPVGTAPPSSQSAQAAPPTHYQSEGQLPTAKPAARGESTNPTPTRTPLPVVPTPPPEEPPSGFVGRLKGLFKKG